MITASRRMRKMLTKDEELALFETLFEAKNAGDEREIEAISAKIVEAFYPLVVKMVKRMSGYRLDPEELESEATMGLIKAIRDFDPENGNRFSAYATACIRGTLFTFITRNYFIVNVCTNSKNKALFFKIRRIMRDNINETGNARLSEETIEMLATRHEVDVSTLRDMIVITSNPSESLDAPISNGDESLARVDMLVDNGMTTSQKFEHQQSREMVRTLIKAALDRLDERSRDIAYFQIVCTSEERLTLGELGELYDISRERVRQIRNEAHRKIKKFIQKDADKLDIPLDELF